jgi:hypothetical protein
MNVFEKIREKLEETKTKKYVSGITSNAYEFGACHALDDAIEIVNQVEEEYAKDTNVRTSNEIKSLDEVIARLQYKADNIKAKLEPSYFTECIDYLKSLPKGE